MPVRALNLYYARDAKSQAQVLATRMRATDVRQSIGLTRGRVFVRANGAADLPDVLWDCPFADAGAHDVDMQARAASVEFEGCRAVMRTLTRRFERVIYDEIHAVAAHEVNQGEHLVQLWLVGAETPDIEPLRALSATALLHRTDDNATLPDWILELADGSHDPERALQSRGSRHPAFQATLARWQRAA